jgi:hypothetical protein
MRAAVDTRKATEQAHRGPREELKMYLEAPLESVENVVAWWGVSYLNLPLLIYVLLTAFQQHSLQYPILSRIAQDYLAIQGSATPSEQAFSSGALTDTKRRNHLSPPVFEALQILKRAYCNGHVIAGDQAEEHHEGLIAALSVLEETEEEF